VIFLDRREATSFPEEATEEAAGETIGEADTGELGPDDIQF